MDKTTLQLTAYYEDTELIPKGISVLFGNDAGDASEENRATVKENGIIVLMGVLAAGSLEAFVTIDGELYEARLDYDTADGNTDFDLDFVRASVTVKAEVCHGDDCIATPNGTIVYFKIDDEDTEGGSTIIRGEITLPSIPKKCQIHARIKIGSAKFATTFDYDHATDGETICLKLQKAEKD
ncbi:MAG: hypothetical protein ABIJ92_04575 [Candidatus Aenigmatarchaeota archaeon]